MATPKPYGGTSVARLTASVNRANRKNLKYGVDITFGAPQEIAIKGRNTQVDVIPLKNTNKFKTAPVYYTRLPIGVISALSAGFRKPVEIYSVPFSIHEILPRINAALGLDLVIEEVENTTYTERQSSYTLTIKEGSFGWLPSSVEFEAEQIEGTPLSSILTVTVLNGLHYNPQ